MRRDLFSFLALMMLVWGVAACQQALPEAPQRLSAVAALRAGAEADAGFARALAPIDFEFPADHGPHDDFAIEWWYFTGNLTTTAATSRRFGYQLTFFRTALSPPGDASASGSESRWSSRQIYLAHFALTDVGADRFAAAEQISRGAVDLAGARAEPFAVWVLDWQATTLESSVSKATSDSIFPLRLEARAMAADGQPFAIDLVLDAGKPRVLHGDSGLSRKGAAPGDASYYVSRTRMPSRGTVTSNGEVLPVEGSSWLDREWSTSVLEAEQIGWDWFSLQLDDGRELMVFDLRRSDGTIDAASHGTLVDAGPDARVVHLDSDAYTIEVLDHWTSPRGARYPSRWRIVVPDAGLDLWVEPWIADQELDVSFRYYEGAVRARDAAGNDVGVGYVELVGYAESPDVDSLE